MNVSVVEVRRRLGVHRWPAEAYSRDPKAPVPVGWEGPECLDCGDTYDVVVEFGWGCNRRQHVVA